MKKFIVISALFTSLVACDKEDKAPATEVAADAADATNVAQDVTVVDATVETSTDVTPVENPDASSSTDASVGG